MAEIRAAQLQEDLLALAALRHDDASRIVAELSPATVRRIMNATRVDWLPAELNVELARAGHLVVGDDGLRSWGRASVRRSMESSLLGPILHGAIRVFGLSPGAILRTAPAAYRAAFRGCGTMVVDGTGDGCRRVLLQDLPPALRDRCFVLAMAGALEGVFDVCGVEGGSRLVSPSIGACVELEVTWRLPSPERGAEPRIDPSA